MATRGGRGRGRGRGRDALINPPPPPPVTMEQILGMQAQLMQAMMQRLDNEPARGPLPVQVRAWPHSHCLTPTIAPLGGLPGLLLNQHTSHHSASPTL